RDRGVQALVRRAVTRVPARALAGVRGFVFDLDGCVWNGSALNPAAGETLAALHRAGRGLAFLTNNSRETGDDIRRRLHAVGVTVARPSVVGKPGAPRFRMGLERLGLARAGAAMVGDSLPSDSAGARAVGMRTVLYAPAGAPADAADLVVGSFAELAAAAGVG